MGLAILVALALLRSEFMMNWNSLLRTVVNYGLTVYLVSHGLSIPTDSPPEPWEMVAALYVGSFGWLRVAASWWPALRIGLGN